MRKIILHGHIFKNAGTTFDWSLERNFGEAFVDHREDREMRREGAPYLLAWLQANRQVAALSSHHLCCPLPNDPTMELLPVFLLRDPIERIGSVYHFERGQESDTPGAVHAKQLSFRDYTLWRMRDDVNPTIRNFQTRYCTDIGGRPKRPETREHLEQAKQYLAERACVGVVDRYDESMLLFEQQLADKGIDVSLEHLPQNVANPDSGRTREEKVAQVIEELGDIYELVLEKNALDIELYEFAGALFQQRLEALVPRREDKLVEFRKRCAVIPR